MGVFSKNIGTTDDLDPVDDVRFTAKGQSDPKVRQSYNNHAKLTGDEHYIDIVAPGEKINYDGDLVVNTVGNGVTINVTGSLTVTGNAGDNVSLDAKYNIHMKGAGRRFFAIAGNDFIGVDIGPEAYIIAHHNLEIQSLGKKSNVGASNDVFVKSAGKESSLRAGHNIVVQNIHKSTRLRAGNTVERLKPHKKSWAPDPAGGPEYAYLSRAGPRY